MCYPGAGPRFDFFPFPHPSACRDDCRRIAVNLLIPPEYIPPNMTDLNDLERYSLFCRSRIGQILDRYTVTKNDVAPEFPIAIQAPAGIRREDLPIRRVEPQLASSDGEVPEVDSHRTSAGRCYPQAPETPVRDRLPRAFGPRPGSCPRQAQRDRSGRQRTVDANSRRLAIARLQKPQIVGTQRR